MRRNAVLSYSVVLGCCAVAAPVQAAALLINPGDATGYVTTHAGTTPYTVAAGSTWNEGATAYGTSGVLKYANGTTATGVSAVVSSGAIASNAATINFASPTITASIAGSITGGLFNGDPVEDAIYNGSAASTDSVLGMRVTGLPAGVYDVYVVAAYPGSTSARHPGGTSPARQAVWGFAGTTANSLAYSYANSQGQISGAGSTVLPSEILENTNNAAWTVDDSYEKLTVTLSASQPTLYIVTSGHSNLVGGASGEDRAWLNLVQIVPEPSAALLLAGGAGFLAARRRRRA